MAVQSIRSAKVRSFLTMLGIIIGVGAVIILVNMVTATTLNMRQELESMRRELAETNSARQRAVADRASAAELSSGRLRGAEDSLYSPAEVRAMSRGEVRANLDRIRESMRHWN